MSDAPDPGARSHRLNDTLRSAGLQIQGGLNWLSAHLLQIVGVILLIGAALWLAGGMTRSPWHVAYNFVMRPQGWIFVDSPEVYTRERLINERLAEANWLEEQLAKVGDATNLLSRWDRSSVSMAAGISAVPGEAARPAEPAEQQPLAPPLEVTPSVEQEFRLKSAVRDLIRQRMIENKLDDRHDLLSQSLYILKFDTTILVPAGSRSKAVVRIVVQPPRRIATRRDEASITGASASVFGLDQSDYAAWNEYFGDWTADLQNRINQNIEETFAAFLSKNLPGNQHEALRESIARRGVDPSIRFARNFDYAAILDQFEPPVAAQGSASTSGLAREPSPREKLVNVVRRHFVEAGIRNVLDPHHEARLGEFGLERSFVTFNEAAESKLVEVKTVTSDVFLPIDLIDSYVQTRAELRGDARKAPSVSLTPVTDDYYVVDGECFPGGGGWTDEVTVLEGRFKVIRNNPIEPRLSVTAAQWAAIAGRLQGAPDAGWTVLDMMPFIRPLGSNGGPLSTMKTCKTVHAVIVDAGILNFRRTMSNFDTYSYSVLPRQNANLALSDVAKQAAVFSGLPGTNLGLDLGNQSRSVDLRGVVTTFGGIAGFANDNRSEPVVGWIIDPTAASADGSVSSSAVAMNESVMAIVAVPAWWPEVNLSIERGWINEFGRWTPVPEEAGGAGGSDPAGLSPNPYQLSVTLPHAYDSIDRIILGTAGRDPIIVETDKGAQDLVDGGPARFMVRGVRLWRNTIVTLGAQKADQIEVTPDMGGIIAVFNQLQQLQSACEGTAKLRVWTSDGVVEATDAIEIRSTADGCAAPQAPSLANDARPAAARAD